MRTEICSGLCRSPRDYGYDMRTRMMRYSEATTGDDEIVAGDFDWDGFVNSRWEYKDGWLEFA